MAKPRVFSDSEPGSHAGVYHVVSRFVDRRKLFQDVEREVFRKMMEAFAAFHQVKILTFCLMGNHFHLLVRVPPRPTGFDMPLEQVIATLSRAVGAERMKILRSQFRVWEQCGGQEAIEQWRQRMLGRMFNLSEFMKALKQRFSQWYNRTRGRTGVLWEGRFRCVIVQDDPKALRTMATYIDLNPVRGGLVEDPGEYRWCGYAEAMAGRASAVEGIVQITGSTVDNVHGRAPGAPSVNETPAMRKRRQLRALIQYRLLLGVAGRPRIREDGAVVRRGLNDRLQHKLASSAGIKREQLLKRVRHFTDGVILGSREFIDGWFERNRSWFGGASKEKRRTGARKIGANWRHVYTLRQLRE